MFTYLLAWALPRETISAATYYSLLSHLKEREKKSQGREFRYSIFQDPTWRYLYPPAYPPLQKFPKLVRSSVMPPSLSLAMAVFIGVESSCFAHREVSVSWNRADMISSSALPEKWKGIPNLTYPGFFHPFQCTRSHKLLFLNFYFFLVLVASIRNILCGLGLTFNHFICARES